MEEEENWAYGTEYKGSMLRLKLKMICNIICGRSVAYKLKLSGTKTHLEPKTEHSCIVDCDFEILDPPQGGQVGGRIRY